MGGQSELTGTARTAFASLQGTTAGRVASRAGGTILELGVLRSTLSSRCREWMCSGASSSGRRTEPVGPAKRVACALGMLWMPGRPAWGWPPSGMWGALVCPAGRCLRGGDPGGWYTSTRACTDPLLDTELACRCLPLSGCPGPRRPKAEGTLLSCTSAGPAAGPAGRVGLSGLATAGTAGALPWPRRLKAEGTPAGKACCRVRGLTCSAGMAGACLPMPAPRLPVVELTSAALRVWGG